MDFSNNTENVPNLEELMQLGIQTARQGNRKSARMIFQQVLATDRQNERGWLWMAAIADTPAERARYLKTVLQINPNNTKAQKELNQLLKKRATGTNQAFTYGMIGLAVVAVLILLAVLVMLVV